MIKHVDKTPRRNWGKRFSPLCRINKIKTNQLLRRPRVTVTASTKSSLHGKKYLCKGQVDLIVRHTPPGV